MLKKRGFTIVELLVVIAIIAVLVSLLVPAVQQARSAARNMKCKNNLKQLSLAVHDFHEVHGAFPPARLISTTANPYDDTGTIYCRDEPTWLIWLLPYLEQSPLYEKWDPYLPYGLHDQEVREQVISTYLCPERHSPDDAVSPTETVMIAAPCGCFGGYQEILGGAVTDYVANHGDLSPGSSGSYNDFYFGGNGTGVIISATPASVNDPDKRDWLDKVRMSDVTDGTSNTFLIGESHVPRGKLNQSPFNGAAYYGKYLYHFARVAGPGVPLAHNPDDQRAFEYSFGSHHRGFINFAFADGHVRSVSTHINTRIAGHLANRFDGQTVGEF